MGKHLYLDTARLGQMSPTASKMYADFGRLAAEVPTGPCTEAFLFHGAAAAPEIADRFPELRRWQGVEGLKRQLKDTFSQDCGPAAEILFAARTTKLMKLGVRTILGSCRRVLLTDLIWPPYLEWMLRYFGRTGIDVLTLPLKHAVWNEQLPAGEIAGMIQSRIRGDQCDGLFLPAVTHTGIRLPIASILSDTSTGSLHSQAVIDASQAFGHINTNEWTHHADFTFGGMHKWVRAYLPLSVGIFNRQLTRCRLPDYGSAQPGERNETVNFSPFMTTCGALADLEDRVRSDSRFPWHSFRLRMTANHNWAPLDADATLRSRIQLVRSHQRMNEATARHELAAAGITATVFADSTVRLSFPANDLV